ncbi:MAG: PAS domain S-box protein, partial [Chthoniobacteraceae bacterium]
MQPALLRDSPAHPRPDYSLDTNHRILVVDDNEAIHADFRKILGTDATEMDFDAEEAAVFGESETPVQRGQFEIDFALQGREALELVRAAVQRGERYAVAFMDMRMPPGWDGLETTQKLWEVDPDLQIVICTAYSDRSWEEMMDVIENPERVLILKKPFDSIEVLQFAHALTRKWELSQALTGRFADLEVLVGERTHALAISNQQLRSEISERIRAEAQIREQAALLDKARDAILVRDLDDVVLYWNASAERLYGWTAVEAVGRKVTDLIYKDPTVFLEARRIVIERGEWIGEFMHTTKDGPAIPIEGHWTLVRDDAGRPKSVLAINTDITARKNLEGQLLRSQRMESIGLLAGGIAHDLNNMLSPILMALDILQSRFPDAESRQLLDVLEASAQRGAG